MIDKVSKKNLDNKSGEGRGIDNWVALINNLSTIGITFSDISVSAHRRRYQLTLLCSSWCTTLLAEPVYRLHAFMYHSSFATFVVA